ncbi:MAG: hypothetical protein ACTSRH_14135 [Promethearchaeota archaeon]
MSFNKGDDKIKEKMKIVQLLSEGDFENEWFRKELEALKEWNEKESRLAIERARIIDLDDDEKFAISHARIGGGRITELLKEHYPDLLDYLMEADMLRELGSGMKIFLIRIKNLLQSL